MVKRSFHKICCLLLMVLSFVIALTACNTKVKFKVDFIVDGEIYQTVSTYGEEVIEMPNDPEKEEYIFDGWYLDQDTWEKPFTANSLLDAPLSANMSVYAKWKTVELSSDTQAEFDTFEKTGDYEYSLKVSNATETLSLETLVAVHTLSSWTLSTDEGGNQTIAEKVATLTAGDNTYYVLVTAEDDSTQLYTLKIRRKPIFTVAFDVAGGTSVENQQVEEGGLAIAPEATTRAGYDFSAWDYDFTVPITENKTIVASWTAKEYTISYELNGGRLEMNNPETYYIESGEITLAKPTKEDYMFDGWYTSSTFEADSKVAIIPTGSMGNLQLYAKWTYVDDSVDNLPNVKVTQTLSQYVTNRNYATMESGNYKAFTDVANPAYLVPGLMEGLIPQGLDVWEDRDLLLISAYFDGNNTSGSPSSMIVAVDLKTGTLWGKYCLKNMDGSNHTGHVGGLAVTERNIFLANSRTLYRIPLSQIISMGKSGTLNIVEEIKVPVLASFCNYSNGVLWVGDFTRTELTDRPNISSVSKYTAWSAGYVMKNTESEFSSENWDPATMPSATPDYIFSITNKVQGFTFVGDKVVLSTSYGRNNNSNVYIYNNPMNSKQDTNITLNGKSIPVWVLDGTYLKNSYTLMPMAEGASSYNGKLLLVFESSTRKYYNGKNPTDHVWSVTI